MSSKTTALADGDGASPSSRPCGDRRCPCTPGPIRPCGDGFDGCGARLAGGVVDGGCGASGDANGGDDGPGLGGSSDGDEAGDDACADPSPNLGGDGVYGSASYVYGIRP
jgi:hypothetical protein